MSEKKIDNTKKSFDIRSYHPGDENEICVLFERVFGKPMGATESMMHWQWKFLENPLKEILIKMAWDDKKLAGQYAASPVSNICRWSRHYGGTLTRHNDRSKV